MQQIYRRTLMPKCDFNNVAKQLRTHLGGCFCKLAKKWFRSNNISYLLFHLKLKKNNFENFD